MAAAVGLVINSFSLQVNERSLTGESTNVDKQSEPIEGEVALGDRTNMVYSGSLITYGRAVVLVTETGMDTEIGKIAQLMNDTKDKRTPLQISLDDFSKKLAMLIMVISLIVFLLGIYRREPLLDALMFAVALAVAAIPEALGSIVTIVQAMGTTRMAKENAIIKKLSAVESLGSVSVICSDKTGTLTQNKMTVQKIYIDGQEMGIEGLDLSNQLHRYLMYDAILTNDSSLSEEGVGVGDPTEYALLEMGRKANVKDVIIKEAMVRKAELPFDSDRKMMSTLYAIHCVDTMLTKGAVDVMLDRCTAVRYTQGIKAMDEQEKAKIVDQNMKFSMQGLRVLAFAYRECVEKETLEFADEQQLTFLGLVAMIDPPREESMEAVKQAKSAGIKTVMITGDHKVTASAIAKQIGILNEGELAITGQELDAMSDAELDQKITSISVYARVSPENKILFVNAWQRQGRLVAMTGDGVNDAPALKKADIGVAMGITGTEVSKDAASMILTDDNFATIIKAVANGRCIYRNITNSIAFLLSGNLAAILVVVFASICALPQPFAPVQLLFINLLTDSLPAIAIGMEPAGGDLLRQPPRDPKEGILTRSFLTQVGVQGLLIALAVGTAFMIGYTNEGAMTGCTMGFATLTLARLFHGFNCRGKQSIFKLGMKSNPFSGLAFLLGVVLLGLVLLMPSLHSLFEVSTLSGQELLMIGGLAIAPTVLIQLYKMITVRDGE